MLSITFFVAKVAMPAKTPFRKAPAQKPESPSARRDGMTMQAIARLAGVSAMTVSRALKSDASVSLATRERVLKIVGQVGYVPDAAARQFATRRSGFVATLVPSLNNSNFADTVRAMSERFDAAGLQMLIGDTQYSLSREEDLIGAFLQRRPEAIVLTGGVHSERTRALLGRADVPVVETWDLPARPLGDVVGFSNREAGAAMVRYLYERGRRRIGFVGGKTNFDTRGAERRAGFKAAMRELRLPDDLVVLAGSPPLTTMQGAELLEALLKRGPDADAIVCVSDLVAFGALAECQRRGLDVPGRLAVVGFGDFDVARACHPRLTTIAIDCAAIGHGAAEAALGAIEARRTGEKRAPTTQQIPFRVVARETG